MGGKGLADRGVVLAIARVRIAPTNCRAGNVCSARMPANRKTIGSAWNCAV
jgi:hypothetical protein